MSSDSPPFDSSDRIVFVLDQPQDLVNIAGVVRAMKNMGLHRLRLVQPAEFDRHRITGIAHRADDVVSGVRILRDLREAVADCVYVLGTSARPRTAQRNYGRPRELASGLVERTREGHVALVFGREDRGLTNEALDLCHGVVIVPTDPSYPSLNLAQAALVLAYEIRMARAEVGDPAPPLPTGKRSAGAATQGELESMFAALRGGLETIGFFKARRPRTVMRTLRTLLLRAEPDRHEAGLVRAVGYEMGHWASRMLARLEREGGERGPPGKSGDNS